MAEYSLPGQTRHLGAAHQNYAVAIKVDSGGAPGAGTMFQKLTETQADTQGNYDLRWGDNQTNTEQWDGRVIVVVVDDLSSDGEFQCKAFDWLVANEV